VQTLKMLGIAFITVVALSAAAGANERRHLPVFRLTDVTGQAVSSGQLTRAGNWLLVYVRPDCRACDAVLQSVEADDAPWLAPRIAVVVQAVDLAAVEATQRRFPSLAGATWYGDAAAGARALRVTNAPVVFGVRDGIIEWSVAGVLSDATDVKTIMANWAR